MCHPHAGTRLAQDFARVSVAPAPKKPEARLALALAHAGLGIGCAPLRHSYRLLISREKDVRRVDGRRTIICAPRIS